MAYWIDNADSWICSHCKTEVANPNYYHNGDIECPFCHSRMEASYQEVMGDITGSVEFKTGYQRAFEDLNTPMTVLYESWNPTECPRCHRDFSDYEPCNDGYYQRATNMERCPYCGQLLDWSETK